MTDPELQSLLRPVARSFSVNLRLLPHPMRKPLSLAYLLARLSDTIADAPGTADFDRLRLLRSLRGHPASVTRFTPGFPLHVFPGERQLWDAWDDLKQEFEDSQWQAEISAVWRRILDGQIFDLQRKLDNVEKTPLLWSGLLEYCDAVAGSVGLFWNEIGGKIWPDWTNLPLTKASELARAYGWGLQLLNMSRDAATDAENGRVYVAATDLCRATGMIRSTLYGGLHFARSLRTWRLRWATSLPAALALSLLPSVEAGKQNCRLTRQAVRRLLLRSLWRSRVRI